MQKGLKIDLLKLALQLLKKCWIIILCGIIGFGLMYWVTEYRKTDTYTAWGTMYVLNANPNLVNYQYTDTSDLNSAVQLLDTYMVVIKSNKVLDVIVERLIPSYPGISADYIANSLSMGSISKTGVMEVQCTTDDPQKSADICNAVFDVAPAEIIRVVSAGNIEIIDYATPPLSPDNRNPVRKGLIGAALGVLGAIAVLTLLFVLFQRIESSRELTECYTPPVLAEVRRDKKENKDPGGFLLTPDSPLDTVESYAKLRMNLFYIMENSKNHVVMVTSALSGEGKSTVTANLAISCARAERKALLIDADMRRACLQEIFHYDDREVHGLSDVLTGKCSRHDAIFPIKGTSLDIMPAGHYPDNPAELLESPAMKRILEKMSKDYDIILIDTPPVNIVSDPMALAPVVAGTVIVVRQGFSDHREIRKALIAAETSGLNVLGFVFYGEDAAQGSYNKRNYQSYYTMSDSRGKSHKKLLKR